MKLIELSTTKLASVNLTLNEGKSVVRNYVRINGLIGVRKSLIPSQYHGLLAKAVFGGTTINESIVWQTDVFDNFPSRLSDLSGDEYDKYKHILTEALNAYAQAFSDAENSVKKLLYAAVTCHSDSSVYCANDRVVITEWGMIPKGASKTIGMPYSIDATPISDQLVDDMSEDSTTGSLEQDLNSETSVNDNQNVNNTDIGDSQKDDSDEYQVSESDISYTTDLQDDQKEPDEFSEGSSDVHQNDNGQNKGKKRRLWPLLIPILLLAILLLSLLFRNNSSAVIPIEDVTPPMDSSQVVISDDSLRYVVENRLLLLLTEESVSIDDFVKAFREKYKDASRYVLSNPDTIINRITLTMPADERSLLEEELPTQFQDFGLIVIPESMYKSSYRANDPEFNDANKRWYFDECSVFAAWDVTMGSGDIVVAVIDDGFDLNHPELKGKIVDPYNAVLHSPIITPSPGGHGTHVAATAVGSADNAKGLSGVAPKCKLMPIQVGDIQGNMTTSAVMDAVVYAINKNADVVNMSLGMSFGPFVQFAPLHVQKNFRANMFLQEERVWNHLFNIARQRNVTFVIAAGNENCIVGMDPMQRSHNTIKVSAVMPNQQKAQFSNYGDLSTVSAPGVRIYNAIPGNNYTYMDGTSMASPIVAGGCALLKSTDPYLSVSDLAQILRETGKPSPSEVGPIVNFAKALKVEFQDVDECAEVNKRYHELLAELEDLKKNHPGCIQVPDTLSIPEELTLEHLQGRWKSTTSLYNQQQEEVVIYFTFNGTSVAQLDIVEPTGLVFTAPLSVSVSNDRIYIDQVDNAVCAANGKAYNPYKFVLKPGKDRKAEGNAKNKVEMANEFDFKLIKI